MKTFFRMVMLLGVVFFLLCGSALAVPFSSTGTVDPNYNNSWDAVLRTGIARFVLTIDEDWPQVNYVTLEFESDIFDFTGWDASNITVISPTNWSTSIFSNANGYEFSLSTDDDTVAISPIVIDVAYTLIDVAMYTNAAGNGWAWDEGQAWALTYTMGDSTASALNPVTSGGSTAPVVPEPTTMLLVGCGLAGLAILREKRGKINLSGV